MIYLCACHKDTGVVGTQGIVDALWNEQRRRQEVETIGSFFIRALDDHVSKADAENDDLGHGVRCSKCSIPILGVLRHDIHWSALHFGCKYESEFGSTLDNLNDDTCNKMNARCSVQKNLSRARRSNVVRREDAPSLQRRSSGSALPSGNKENQGS